MPVDLLSHDLSGALPEAPVGGDRHHARPPQPRVRQVRVRRLEAERPDRLGHCHRFALEEAVERPLRDVVRGRDDGRAQVRVGQAGAQELPDPLPLNVLGR